MLNTIKAIKAVKNANIQTANKVIISDQAMQNINNCSQETNKNRQISFLLEDMKRKSNCRAEIETELKNTETSCKDVL